MLNLRGKIKTNEHIERENTLVVTRGSGWAMGEWVKAVKDINF